MTKLEELRAAYEAGDTEPWKHFTQTKNDEYQDCPFGSCGCLRDEVEKVSAIKHGGCKSRTYQSWRAMRERCSNPNNSHYNSYGGRGIIVCERWNDFALFLADMGERPVNKTLDRINNNGNYEPSNCRWATDAEQRANKRSRKKIYGHSSCSIKTQ